MRKFKRINVVKVTDDDNKASQLLAQGYIEIAEEKTAKKPRSRKTAGEGGDDNGEPDKAQDTARDQE